MLKNYTFILVSIILINSNSYCTENNNLYNAMQYLNPEVIKQSLSTEDISGCKINYTKQKNYVKLVNSDEKSTFNLEIDYNKQINYIGKEDYLTTHEEYMNYIKKMTQNYINLNNIYFHNQYIYYEQNRHLGNGNMKYNKFDRQLNNNGMQKFNSIIYNNYQKPKYKFYDIQNKNRYKYRKHDNKKYENTKEDNK